MFIIEVKNLTKKYGSFTAVDNINFSVKRGEVFGILGPNGAGKTTTLEMIEGLRSITSGKIIVDKIDVAKNPKQVKSIIGVQLQSSEYFDHLTVKELLDLFASFYGLRVNALKLLAELNLQQKANAYADTLSGGQKQRLSIATTLVNNPKIVFLDEPTTGLDPQARRNMWRLINQIRSRGQTILITTHYMEEAQELCDRVAIMDQGKIIDLNTPQALIKKHGSGTIISFRSAKNISQKFLLSLPKVNKVHIDNHRYKILTHDELATLKKIMAQKNRLSPIDLAIRPSTLEDVFLNLTGRKLRE